MIAVFTTTGKNKTDIAINSEYVAYLTHLPEFAGAEIHIFYHGGKKIVQVTDEMDEVVKKLNGQ